MHPKGPEVLNHHYRVSSWRLLVREGDTVKLGQKLLVLEAMKMENNIDADKPGKVVSI